MNKSTTQGTRILRQNFRHWTFHISLCSAPSSYLAYNSGYSSTHCVAAMCIGIAIFIVFYSFLTSSRLFQGVKRNPTLSKSIRWGTNLRSSISVVGAIGLVLGKTFHQLKEAVWVLLTPDLFSGTLALRIVESVGKSWPIKILRISVLGDDPTIRSKDLWLGNMNSFFPTLLAVLIEGLIISISLFTICFVLALILKKVDKTGQKKALMIKRLPLRLTRSVNALSLILKPKLVARRH